MLTNLFLYKLNFNMDNFHKSGRCPPPLKIKGDLRLHLNIFNKIMDLMDNIYLFIYSTSNHNFHS